MTYDEIPRNEYTEYIYDTACFEEPVYPQTADDVALGIRLAIKVGESPAFLEGVAQRLTQLGTPCRVSDSEIMLTEVKKRYKAVLGKSCPRTVADWIRGTQPGVTNRKNNYELCYALEMDFEQTNIFFQKHFLTLPFNLKSRTDAAFFYCLYHKKPYSTAKEMLERSSGFIPQENAHTATSQIRQTIIETDNDEWFVKYLSAHCYGNEQQFQLAREIIIRETAVLKKYILKYDFDKIISPDRLNSLTVEALLGYRYQGRAPKDCREIKLPKRFAQSLPNDVTLGKILNGETASYELLRKTLMLLKFFNFYSEADNFDKLTVCGNLLDFFDELNGTLLSCGFSQLYIRHPFDCLLLYCANSYDPITALYCVNEYDRN